MPILTALIAFGIWRHIEHGPEHRAFVLSVALFLLAFLGLGISLWPYAVPYHATLWEAASSTADPGFFGIGTAIILPIVLAYGHSRSGCSAARPAPMPATVTEGAPPRSAHRASAPAGRDRPGSTGGGRRP